MGNTRHVKHVSRRGHWYGYHLVRLLSGLACLGVMSSYAGAAVYRLPSSAFGVYDNTDAEYQTGAGAEFLDDDCWHLDDTSDNGIVRTFSGIPAGTYYVAVRASYYNRPYLRLIGFENSTTRINNVAVYVSGSLDASANRHFWISGRSVGYKEVTSFTTNGGNFQLRVDGSGAYLDDVIIYQDGDYSTEPILPDYWLSVVVELNHAASPPSLDLFGNRNGESFAHTFYYDENGNFQSVGDLSPEDQYKAVAFLVDSEVLHDDQNASIDPRYQTDGVIHRQGENLNQYMLSEYYFAYCCQIELLSGGPPAWWNRAAVASIWTSENRFSLLGDPLGDVAWRVRLKLLELQE